MSAIQAHAYLIKAFLAKWNAAGTLSGIPLSKDTKIDNGDGHPYAILIPGATEDLFWTCERKYYRTELNVHVYDTTAANAVANMLLVGAVFDDEDLSLTFDAGGMVRHRPLTSVLLEDEPAAVEHQEGGWLFETYIDRG